MVRGEGVGAVGEHDLLGRLNEDILRVLDFSVSELSDVVLEASTEELSVRRTWPQV